MLHIAVTAPPAFVDMRLADVLVILELSNRLRVIANQIYIQLYSPSHGSVVVVVVVIA